MNAAALTEAMLDVERVEALREELAAAEESRTAREKVIAELREELRAAKDATNAWARAFANVRKQTEREIAEWLTSEDADIDERIDASWLADMAAAVRASAYPRLPSEPA